MNSKDDFIAFVIGFVITQVFPNYCDILEYDVSDLDVKINKGNISE